MRKNSCAAVLILWILAGIRYFSGTEEKYQEKVPEVLAHIGEQETSAVLKYQGILAEGEYLFFDLDFENDIKKAFLVQEELHRKENPYVRMQESSINVRGSYRRELLLAERNQKVDELLKTLNAKVVSEYRSQDFFTVYAYTPYIADYKLQKGQPVNVNIALQYDEEENQTYIYAAVPILEMEY